MGGFQCSRPSEEGRRTCLLKQLQELFVSFHCSLFLEDFHKLREVKVPPQKMLLSEPSLHDTGLSLVSSLVMKPTVESTQSVVQKHPASHQTISLEPLKKKGEPS